MNKTLILGLSALFSVPMLLAVGDKSFKADWNAVAQADGVRSSDALDEDNDATFDDEEDREPFKFNTLVKVQTTKDAAINNFKNTLRREEIKRGRVQLATLGVGVTAGLGLLVLWTRKFWQQKQLGEALMDSTKAQVNAIIENSKAAEADAMKKALASNKEILDLKAAIRKLEEEIGSGAEKKDELENKKAVLQEKEAARKEDNAASKAPSPAQSDNPGWFQQKALGMWEVLKGGSGKLGWWVVGLPVLIFKSQLYHTLNKLTSGFFPWPARFASYITTSWSVTWAMTNRTKLDLTLMKLKSEAVALRLIFKKENPVVNAEIVKYNVWLAATNFVVEMEKMLGYMEFVVNQLPLERRSEREMGRMHVSLTREHVDGFAQMINGFLASEGTLKDCQTIIATIEDGLFEIIKQLEGFEYIAIDAGYEDPDGRDRFAYWKGYVKPAGLPRSPKQQEDDAKAAELVDVRKVVETVIDWNDILSPVS